MSFFFHIRMAGVFDIELHDGDGTTQDESDDDVIESREVERIHLISFELFFFSTAISNFELFFFIGGI